MAAATSQWIITAGSVLFAFACALWAIQEGLRRRNVSRNWLEARRAMDTAMARTDILFRSDPDLTLIWDEGHGASVAGAGRGGSAGLQAPDQVLGRGTALDKPNLEDAGVQPTDIVLDADDIDEDDLSLNERFEAFVASLEDGARQRFAAAVARLRGEGKPFRMTLTRRMGGIIEAHGRPAATQSAVKLRDVSPERTEIETLAERLQQAERDRDSFAELLERAPFPIWRRRGHTLVWANEAYARAVDCASPEDAVEGRRELDSSERSLSALAARNTEVQTKRRYVVVDGQRRAMELIAIPAGDGTGGIALDLSAVDEAQQQLESHLRAHRETLDQLRTAVAIFGADKTLVFHNEAYVGLWGLDPRWLDQNPDDGEILEHLREQRQLPEQADFQAWKRSRLDLYQQVADGDELWHLPDGRSLRVICRAHPFGGLIYLYEDVTDQVTLESSYKTLTSVQRVTLDHLHEAVAVFGRDGRLKLSNAAFARMWGLEQTLLRGEPHFSVLTERCAPQLEEAHLYDDGDWPRIAASVTSIDSEGDLQPGRLIRRDGRILDFAGEALPDGRLLLTFLDVTDTARMEHALRERNEALETADRLKSEFVSNVSYQLRTPLNSIVGFTEMISEGMVGDLTERQSEYTGHILQASAQLRDLIDDILDLAMIEAGTLSLDLDTVNISDLLKNARDVAVSRATDSAVTVSVDCPQSIGAMVADEKRLRQILFNLTTNALRFTEKGDTVTIGAAKKGGMVTIWVADTGSGIPAEYQASVFDRFSSHDSNRRGAGLGLSLVKSFVELHGGWVTLTSEPDKGTRVVCHLPARPQEGSQAAE